MFVSESYLDTGYSGSEQKVETKDTKSSKLIGEETTESGTVSSSVITYT